MGSNDLKEILEMLLYAVPVILLSLGVHEASHAYVSYLLGDPTAKNMGRLTLNPIKHLDPLGTLMLLISCIPQSGFAFGWAKPVPVNPSHYKNWKTGMRLTALAGPSSNFLLALLSMFFVIIIDSHGIYSSPKLYEIIMNFLYYFVGINIGLCCFNLLPFPPLDGMKIFGSFLPNGLYYKLISYEQQISMVFLVILLLKRELLDIFLVPMFSFIQHLIQIILSPLQMLM